MRTRRTSLGPDRKPRVLFVGAFPPKHRRVFGGNITDCRVLLESTFSERLDLELIDSSQISNPAPPFSIRILLAIRRLILFVYRFECKKPDAVLLFTGEGAGLVEKGLMAQYTKIRKSKAYLFPRSGGLLTDYKTTGIVPIWVRASFQAADKVFCQGTPMRNFVVNALGRKFSETEIISNWTATSTLLEIGKNRNKFPPKKIARLLFVGWLEKEKGIIELMEAIKMIRYDQEFALDLVGDGRARRFIEDFIKSNNLGSIITLHGWQYGKQLELRYRDADIFVLPSWTEGLPNAMIEAMAAGLCVIVSDVGNIPDVIQNGINGFLLPSKNIDELAFLLRKVIGAPGLRSSAGHQAYETAKNKFNVEIAVKKIMYSCFPENAVCDTRSNLGNITAS